jgi:diacylglycerol kinase
MKSLIKSFRFALKGISVSFKQRNFKIELFIAVLVIVLGYFFQITATEWCITFIAISMVLVAEMLNTAIEHLVDLVSPDYHKTAGTIKDISAGAVLVSAIFSAVIGVIIFGKYLIAII